MIKNITTGAVLACFAFALSLGAVIAQTNTPVPTVNTTANTTANTTTNTTLNTTSNVTDDQPSGAPRTGFGY